MTVAAARHLETGDESIPESVRRQARSRGLIALYTVAIFVAAALLFVIQPMVGRMVLPRGGGSPQVWNTALVFFQVALLMGYLYAHFSVRWLGVRVQAAAHMVVLLLPFLVLPIALPDTPPPDGNPQAPWILFLLTVGVGAPFFVLAAASPLLQRWLASTRHEDAADPYFLYAGSNTGSLIGLLAYPFLLEPLLPISDQSRLWTVGYGIFVVLALACAAVVLAGEGGPRRWTRASRQAAPPADAGGAGSDRRGPTSSNLDGAHPSTSDRLFWLAAAAVPSLLLLGVTQFLTSRTAPIPLLWVLPLAVYLLTFIAAFARRRVMGVAQISRILSIIVVAMALVMLMRLSDPAWLITILHLSVLGAAGLLCHLRLVERRPMAGHLTEFYLYVSLGGALGGAFGALVAPYVFNQIAEYPVAVVLACFFRVPIGDGSAAPGEGELLSEEGSGSTVTRGRILDIAAPALVAVYIFAGDTVVQAMGSVPDAVFVVLLIVIPSLVCFLFSPRPLRYALGVAVLLTFAMSGRVFRGDILMMDRTFFGVYQVSADEDNTVHIFYHGPTAHGVQYLDPELAGEPLAYYHRSGPAGRVVTALAARPDKETIALVGAGTGALTALAGAHQHVTLYEIDPVVMEIAENPRYFTFLSDAEASYESVVADARIALSRETNRYDLMVLDAFTSGSIPVHLMTREAVELYLDRLRPGGVLLFHISNRHLELGPVLARHAAELGLVAFENIDVRDQENPHIFSSQWVLMARNPADLAYVPAAGWAPMVVPPDAPLWTDDFSNLVRVMRWE